MNISSKKIDIVIPSFRLNESYLLPLLSLHQPANWQFNYFIIVDNPVVQVPPIIEEMARNGEITLHINEKNLGASESRNKGISMGSAEWILFLDDDVVANADLLHQYAQAIESYPYEIGFIGLTDFPEPVNAYTTGLEIGHLSHFRIAQRKEKFTWGVTANMLYRRSSLGELRFSTLFPKSGGGEDIDLPLRVCLQHNREFRCIEEAKVTHPWWNQGKTDYERFVRYGMGSGYLLFFHRHRTHFDFANPVESLILLTLFSPMLIPAFGWTTWLLYTVSVPLFEWVISFLKVSSNGFKSPLTAYYMAMVKSSFEFGVVLTLIKEKKFFYFMKRINPTFSRSQHFRLNKWKIIKLSLYLVMTLYLIIR